VVLEGTLRIDAPGSPAPIMLTPGTYVLHRDPLGRVRWDGTTVSAEGHRAARAFVLTVEQFTHHLPRILLNAMDEGEMHRLTVVL
jgi:hypothetical protein